MGKGMGLVLQTISSFGASSVPSSLSSRMSGLAELDPARLIEAEAAPKALPKLVDAERRGVSRSSEVIDDEADHPRVGVGAGLKSS